MNTLGLVSLPVWWQMPTFGLAANAGTATAASKDPTVRIRPAPMAARRMTGERMGNPFSVPGGPAS
jgi:hypothetical protein